MATVNVFSELLGAFFESMERNATSSQERRDQRDLLIGQVAAFNTTNPDMPITIADTDPKCSPYRTFKDCQDKDCSRHYYDRKRAQGSV